MVPEVTLNWYPQPRQSHCPRPLILATDISPQRVQHTPDGQRNSSRRLRHFSSQLKRSNKEMRFMVQSSKKPRPPDEKDSELAEKVFGKRIKKALDEAVKDVDKKGVPDFMRT